MVKKYNKNRKGGSDLMMNYQPTTQGSASSWFSNAYSSIKKGASDLAQNASSLAQNATDKGSAMVSNATSAVQPTYTQPTYTQPTFGGKGTRRRKGGYTASRSLTNVASSAAPIYGMRSAKAQVWVGGKTRRVCTKRHKHSKSCKVRKYRKGSLSKTHKGDMDFTTKKGNKVYHRKGHYVKKLTMPFSKTMKKMFNMK